MDYHGFSEHVLVRQLWNVRAKQLWNLLVDVPSRRYSLLKTGEATPTPAYESGHTSTLSLYLYLKVRGRVLSGHGNLPNDESTPSHTLLACNREGLHLQTLIPFLILGSPNIAYSFQSGASCAEAKNSLWFTGLCTTMSGY